MAQLPGKIRAGLTFDQALAARLVPSSAWTVHALLRGPSAVDLEAVAGRLRASAAETATWQPGVYAYTLRAILGDDVREIEAGTVEILPDQASIGANYDARSQARRSLDNINAVLEKRASQDQQRYTIDNRELWRTPIADLWKMRDRFAAMVAREENQPAGRQPWGPAARFRF